MFDQFKGMAAMAGLMKDLPRIRARMGALRRELGEARLTGESGGGAIRVTADGLMRIVSVDVDAQCLARLVDPGDPADTALAGELIAEAVNAALGRAAQRVDAELSDAAAEMGLPIPPGILGKLFSP